MKQNIIQVVGKAKNTTKMNICCCCGGIFIVDCKEYVFNEYGSRIRNDQEMQEGWVCEDCKQEILRIKNL